MPMDSRAFLQLQLEALCVRYFIVKYDEFEKKVKHLFTNNISRISVENKQLLYFLLAGIKRSTHIGYSNNVLKSEDAKYSINEKFTHFSLSQIIKIQRQNDVLDLLDFNVPSINRKSTEYPFTDCCIKLLNMRNKIAHEMSHLSFDDNDMIEMLSNEYIKNNSASWFASLDTELMGDETKYIFSNIVMLERIIEILNERGGADEYKTVDNG